MSLTRVFCPTCGNRYPVRIQDLEKSFYCKHCRKLFQPARINEYVLLDELGKGGLSVVYLAYDLRNQREVALKQLHKDVPDSDFAECEKRAVTEARALAAIDFHPNVLPMYNSGFVGKRFFLVTPVVRGKSLDKVIPEGGFPDPLRAVELAVTILRALQHVHDFQIYHRDVKPSNVMIDEKGNLFLIDFGIVSFRQTETAVRTEMGTVLGTPAYMPPEQARGDVHRVGPWSDQYGAGAVLYHMLTGEVPFPGKGLAVLIEVMDYDKQPLPPRHYRPDLDPKLEELVLKSLRKLPGERFGSCAEFADRLHAWAEAWKRRRDGLPPPADQAPQPESVSRQPRRFRAVIWTTIIIAALSALATGGWLAWKLSQDSPPPKLDDITK
jgi:serine/threonine-protein kinase